MKLTPYLSFEGDCEEALNIYKKILNGKLEVVNRYDNPAMNAPEEYKHKILHARLSADDIQIFASDTLPGAQPKEKSQSKVALSLEVGSPEKGKEIFEQLAEGGKVNVPFQKQFWGAWHGNLIDRFGIYWMVNCE